MWSLKAPSCGGRGDWGGFVLPTGRLGWAVRAGQQPREDAVCVYPLALPTRCLLPANAVLLTVISPSPKRHLHYVTMPSVPINGPRSQTEHGSSFHELFGRWVPEGLGPSQRNGKGEGQLGGIQRGLVSLPCGWVLSWGPSWPPC